MIFLLVNIALLSQGQAQANLWTKDWWSYRVRRIFGLDEWFEHLF